MTWLEQLALTNPYASKLYCNLTPEEEAAAAAAANTKKDDVPDPLEAAKKESADLKVKLANEKLEREKLQKTLDDAEKAKLEEQGDFKAIALKESERAEAADKRALETVTKSQERVMTAELKARLALEGVEDPDYHVLADKTKLKMEGDEVVGLDEVIADLRERKPSIFKKEPTTVRRATPPAKSGNEPAKGKKVSEMTPEEYKAFKPKFIRSLKLVANR